MNAPLSIWGGLLSHKLIAKGILKIMAAIIKYHFQIIQVSTGVQVKFTHFFTYDFIFKVLHVA